MSSDHPPPHSTQQNPPPHPPPPQPGVARVGKYLMLDLLGEGAFGKVRIAVDETTGKQYAMKIMEKSHIKANELTLQVRREIAVMKAMRHPNIVNLHEVLTSSKNLYMVMDLVTGGELFDAVAAAGKLPENRTRLYFQQLVDAVDYCHSRRVYHRDLKPENLLLSSDHHTLKITDFGLSSIKAQNPSTELLHTIMGSPHYIAPEIITSAASGYEGSKVDVWAAGVILFGMLAGFLPFDEPTNRDLYNAIVHAQVKYPPHFSYDVIKLLRAMLQKDPAKRPTMAHLRHFAWFKVDYHPAVLPAPPHHSSAVPIGPRRKSKKPARHRPDRVPKKKPSEPPRPTPDPAGHENSHATPVAHSLPHPGAAAAHAPHEGGNDAHGARPHNPADAAHNAPDQENVDPTLVKPRHPAPDDNHQPNADNLKQPPLLPPAPLTPHRTPPAVGKPPHHHHWQNNHAHDSDATACDVAHAEGGERDDATRGICLGEVDAGGVVVGEGDVARVPGAYGLTRGAEGACGEGVDGDDGEDGEPDGRGGGTGGEVTPRMEGKEGFDVSLFASPLSPEGGRVSGVHCGGVTSFGAVEERRRESLRYVGGEVGAFVSPVSLRSGVSFSSQTEGAGEGKQVLSPDYRSLVPQLFAVQSDEKEGGEGGGMVAIALHKGGASVDGGGKQQNAEVEADGAVDSGPAASHGLEECIFKPMKSLFAPLVEQTTERRESASVSASVFCPEFDSEADGSPQWCLDNMEVFADVEGEEDAPEVPGSARGTTSRILRDVMRQRERAAESNAEDEAPKAKSIFAPLDDGLAFKLSPSAENEATTTKALKSLPQAKQFG